MDIMMLIISLVLEDMFIVINFLIDSNFYFNVNK